VLALRRIKRQSAMYWIPLMRLWSFEWANRRCSEQRMTTGGVFRVIVTTTVILDCNDLIMKRTLEFNIRILPFSDVVEVYH
jgi:hypothetical protein